MKESTRIFCVLAGFAVLSIGIPSQSEAQVASNQGPDHIDKTGDAIVATGAGLGPNETSLANAVELLCPKLVARVPGSTAVPTTVPLSSGGATSPTVNVPTSNIANPQQVVQQFLEGRAPVSGDPRSPQEIDLQRRCTELVQYRKRTQGSSSQYTGLNTVLREMNMDEAAAQGRGLVEFSAIRVLAVATRLQKLRLADAGNSGTMVAFQPDSGRFTYNFETGGGAGDDSFSRWTVYGNGALSSGSRDTTTLESGYDLSGGRATVGADYRVSNTLFVGASLDYISTTADFTNDSKLDTDGYDVTLYGTTYTDSGLYFQGTIGAGSNDYTQHRRIQFTVPGVPGPLGTGPAPTTVNQTALGDTSGSQFFASAGVGKDINAGRGMTGNLSATLDYLDASIDGFTESIDNTNPGFGMALTVSDQTVKSLRSTVGAQLSKAISTTSGVVQPYARANWIHEFDNGSRSIIARFASDSIDTTAFELTTNSPNQDYFRLGGGVSAVFPHGLQAFVSVDTVLGLSNFNYYSITAGLSKEL
ncbi:MAG: autotransporter outer membrane beta-barrel domain-containing protein [Arenicellales bacterium]